MENRRKSTSDGRPLCFVNSRSGAAGMWLWFWSPTRRNSTSLSSGKFHRLARPSRNIQVRRQGFCAIPQSWHEFNMLTQERWVEWHQTSNCFESFGAAVFWSPDVIMLCFSLDSSTDIIRQCFYIIQCWARVIFLSTHFDVTAVHQTFWFWCHACAAQPKIQNNLHGFAGTNRSEYSSALKLNWAEGIVNWRHSLNFCLTCPSPGLLKEVINIFNKNNMTVILLFKEDVYKEVKSFFFHPFYFVFSNHVIIM